MTCNNQRTSILLIEDLKEHAEYTRLLLEKQDISVKTAEDEVAALTILQKNNVDLILLDVTLKDGDGFDFCKKLRADEKFSNIPVIFLTSKSDVQDKVTGFQAGGDDYLTKPFKLPELLARIELSLQKKRLSESENRYSNFVKKINSLVFMLNPSGKIVDVNPKVVEAFGIEASEILNHPFNQILHHDSQKVFKQSFDDILAGEEINQVYLKLKKGKRNFIPVEVNGFGLKLGNQVIQVQLVMNDITEQERLQAEVRRYTRLLEQQVEKRTEELDEVQRLLILSDKMGTIGQLAAGIAHELRNPLGIIGTSTYYLNRTLQDYQNPKVREHLEIIQSEISRSQKIITNLLDFSRKSSSDRESADLNKILRQTISLIERELDNHEIETSFKLEKIPLSFINVDEMKQVFLNLLLNAKEAMPNGGKLKITSRLSDRSTILIKIQDSGVGIHPKHLEKIYEPFFTTKSQSEGTGLGLSLVHASVKRNGGTIRAESVKGKGTCFYIYLPVADVKS